MSVMESILSTVDLPYTVRCVAYPTDETPSASDVFSAINSTGGAIVGADAAKLIRPSVNETYTQRGLLPSTAYRW